MRPVIVSALACCALLVPLASAQPPETLMPGVSFVHESELTSHGPVAYSVITVAQPTGLTSIIPVLGGGTITGPRETLSQLEESVASIETVAGVNGDFFTGAQAVPAGIVIAGGALEHVPTAGRSSIGFDPSGTMHVARISFTGTWQGSGQRQPLTGVNQPPKANQAILFTPAWGSATPVVAGAVTEVLEPFPSAQINTDLDSTVGSVGDGSSPVAIPADGAVLLATGSAATTLQADAPQSADLTVRLTLPPAWSSVSSAVGGGPLLVRGGRPVFTTGESFSSADLTSREPRTGVGQLADGRLIFVTADGGRPGYSVGMTTYELAQTLVKLGAVTGAALEYGNVVSAAFNGGVLDRPQQGEQKIKEALVVSYQGVVAADPTPSLIATAGASGGVSLAYRIVRPSTVTASVIGPNGVKHVVDQGSRQPGSYHFTWSSFDAEGTWHWNVQASDDANRSSSDDRTFRYDLTLSSLAAARSQTGGTDVSFSLSRPASVVLQITAANGTLVSTSPAASLAAGPQSIPWDGTIAGGVKAPAGSYIATLLETSAIGSASAAVPFTLAG